LTLHLFLAVEDQLTLFVGERLIREVFGSEIKITPIGLKGNGYLRSRLNSFKAMANNALVILITDLDNLNCAPTLIHEWFEGTHKPNNLLFRVAVREIEAWVMADREGLARFLEISLDVIPRNPESLIDPKSTLIKLARKSKKEIRTEIVPSKGTFAKQGLGYNAALKPFVEGSWSINTAIENSDSLKRAVNRITEAKQTNSDAN
jgi:hypothetical protein